MITAVPFAGSTYAGEFEMYPGGFRVYAAPLDGEAYPHLASVVGDMTPDQADDISEAFSRWAAFARARLFSNGQLDLLEELR